MPVCVPACLCFSLYVPVRRVYACSLKKRSWLCVLRMYYNICIYIHAFLYMCCVCVCYCKCANTCVVCIDRDVILRRTCDSDSMSKRTVAHSIFHHPLSSNQPASSLPSDETESKPLRFDSGPDRLYNPSLCRTVLFALSTFSFSFPRACVRVPVRLCFARDRVEKLVPPKGSPGILPAFFDL